MAETETDDQFAYMIELCHISSSQEEILRHCPFVGQTVNSPNDGAPPSSGGIPVASAGIAITTLPETAQDAGKDRGSQDVFHTPPEQQSSLSASDLHHRAIHKAVETDDETQGFVDFSEYAEAAEFVDLSDDSELGFPQVKLKQRIDHTLVAECSHGNDGASVIEISNCKIDKFQFSKRELSSKDSLGESPHKKMKHSEQNPGFESSQACFGIEPQKIGEDLDNCERKLASDPRSPCDFGADPQPQQNVQIGKEMGLGLGDKENACGGMPVEKNSGFSENLGSRVTQSEIARSARKLNFDDTEECVENIESREGNCEAEKSPCTGEGNKTVNEIAETSGRQKGGDKQRELRVLPSSIRGCLENAAKGKKENGKGNSIVFDVLKALREENCEQVSLENVCWLQLANTRGFNFPRPCWRMEKGNEKN